MTVTQAISVRRCARGFKPDPVGRDTITRLLEAAARAPSWANSQPWEVFVAQGETLRAIREGYARCYADGVKAAPEVDRPTQWPESAKKRQKALRPDMVRDCGDAADQFGALNQRLFDAPAVLFVCMDKSLSPWSLYDLGAYSQNFMLAATEAGLGTIPAVTAVHYPQVLRRELHIPDHLKIVIGIPFGYVDGENAINNFRSARDPLEENVTFRG